MIDLNKSPEELLRGFAEWSNDPQRKVEQEREAKLTKYLVEANPDLGEPFVNGDVNGGEHWWFLESGGSKCSVAMCSGGGSISVTVMFGDGCEITDFAGLYRLLGYCQIHSIPYDIIWGDRGAA